MKTWKPNAPLSGAASPATSQGRAGAKRISARRSGLGTTRSSTNDVSAALPLVFPVAVEDAQAWAIGTLGDLHLLLHAPLVPGAVYFADLPNLAAYKFAVRQCAHWRRAGAIGMICRTSNQIVADHLEEFGARPVSQDVDGRLRFLMPTEGFNRWLGKF